MQPVVVSGVGTLGSFGLGLDALRRALADGRPSTSEIERSITSDHPPGGARLAALVGRPDLSRWVTPAAARRMSGPSKLAVAAARMAVCQASLEGVEEGWQETAVVMSTAFGPADFTERLIRAISVDGPTTASPFHFTESVANAPAAQIAIDCRAMGPNVTVTQREAGALVAVARAATEVGSGRVRRALTGSAEEMTPLLHSLLDRFGALARATPELPEAARPFDRRRNGFLAGEGATVLVLERESEAIERGARVLARIRAGASAFDATASRVGWGRGAVRLSLAVQGLLARLGLGPSDLDLVVSGASGAVAGDRLEAEILTAVFSETGMPTVLAPKAVTGEYGGGQLAAAVLAAGGGAFGPTAGFEEPDPALQLRPHAGGPFRGGRVLASSLAAGGAAAWLVLERP
jgi:3-oxoacyl-[acyl-carrier-protein] synthase II